MHKSPLELTLILHYGPYVPAGKAADLLSYPSLQALIAARRRGRLPFCVVPPRWAPWMVRQDVGYIQMDRIGRLWFERKYVSTECDI